MMLMTNPVSVRPTGMRFLIALGTALLLQLGCNDSPAPPGPASEAIVTLTPRCAAQLHKLMKKDDRRKILFINVNVAPNCTGFQYAMEFREAPPAEKVVLTSSERVPLAIDSEDAAFLKGTTLDYLADPGGFKFSNPREEKKLLREYRELAEEEARLRPIEEAKANKVDPAKAVAELLTVRRQAAFDDLRLWWKFHQPEAYPAFDEVGRVDRYQQPDGPPITVVFTGDPEQQNGGVYLIKADGLQIPFSSNYISVDDRLADVNGDNIPEIVASDTIGGEDQDDPKKISRDTTILEVFPISSDPRPLLSIVFDARPVDADPTWRWSLADNPSGCRDVVLEQETTGKWTERARFVWSNDKHQYQGPGGSKAEGFLASPGKIAADQIEAFMKRPEGQ